jgi:hypothetical protein
VCYIRVRKLVIPDFRNILYVWSTLLYLSENDGASLPSEHVGVLHLVHYQLGESLHLALLNT